LSHSGSKEQAIFEIKWKAGDITWLPYTQISHLQALVAYLEVMGIDKISSLPIGHGKPPTDDPQIHVGSVSFYEPLSKQKTFICASRIRQFFSPLFDTLLRVSRVLPCVSSSSFDADSMSESTVSSIPSITPMTSTPKIKKFPAVNNRGVYQSGPAEFTMQHPDDNVGLTVPATIRASAVYEFLAHHDVIVASTAAIEIQVAPFGYDKFIELWNAHAGEHGPRFTVWDVDLGVYLQPANLVTLADFNLTRRAPKAVPAVVTTPTISSNVVSPHKAVVHVPKHQKVGPSIYGMAKSSSIATTTTTTTTTTNTTTASTSQGSLALPAGLYDDLCVTTIARAVRQDKHRDAMVGERKRKQKAREAAEVEKKKKKQRKYKKKAPTSFTKCSEDVIMAEPTSNQPVEPVASTSKIQAPASGA
jgi:hypothetical protein